MLDWSARSFTVRVMVPICWVRSASLPICAAMV